MPDEIDRVSLTFSESVVRGSVDVRLTGAGATEREASAVEIDPSRTIVTAVFRPPVRSGDYTVAWVAVASDDAHLLRGTFALRVGTGAVVAAPPTPRVSAARRAAAALPAGAGAARGVANLAIAALLGGSTFVALVWPGGTQHAGVHRLLWASLIVAALAAGAVVVLLAAEISSGSGPGSVAAVVSTRAGVAGVVRLVALPAVAAPLLARLLRSGGRAATSVHWRLAAGVSATAILVTTVLLGHAADDPFRIVPAVLHVAGVSVWLGGLLVIGLVVLPSGRLADLRVAVPRFSALASSAFFAAVAGGFLLARSVVVDWQTLTSTAYGHALFVKGVLVVAILGAALASRAMVRRLERRSRLLQPLRASVGAEIVLAAAVIAATAFLASRPLPVPTAVRAPLGVSR